MTTTLERAEALLGGVHGYSCGLQRVGRLVAYDGLMLEATGLAQPIGACARVRAADGRVARAEVVGFRGDRALLMALEGEAAYVNGARVEPDQNGTMVQVGPSLLGRVVDGLGQPLDGMGPITATGTWPLAGESGNPLQRSRVV
ncbi:MAG: flagellum-specific ATP synthase FliI, partial [Sphingopyxis sp.]